MSASPSRRRSDFHPPLSSCRSLGVAGGVGPGEQVASEHRADVRRDGEPAVAPSRPVVDHEQLGGGLCPCFLRGQEALPPVPRPALERPRRGCACPGGAVPWRRARRRRPVGGRVPCPGRGIHGPDLPVGGPHLGGNGLDGLDMTRACSTRSAPSVSAWAVLACRSSSSARPSVVNRAASAWVWGCARPTTRACAGPRSSHRACGGPPPPPPGTPRG